MAQRVADKLGIGKRAVNMRRESAAAAIGVEIDLDCDTPEELERKAAELEKADKRQHTQPKVVRLKRRKPAPRGEAENPTPPAEAAAGEIDSPIEAWLKAFDALGRTYQLRLVYHACIRLGLDPSKMAPLAEFGLDDEESELDVELPAEFAPATNDAVPEQAEHGDEATVAHAEDDDEAEAVTGQSRDNRAEFGAEDLQDAGDDAPDAADPEIGVTKCAYCKKPLLSSDLPRMKYGRLYHRKNCVDHAKPIAIAA
jgi:hypothetical protein